MKGIALLLMILCLPLPVAASHAWADIDLCEVYQDKLPPGLSAESLPEAHAPGAVLLDRYCTQCHNLPGPDRHTAAEWRDVASRMFLLMDVSKRFGGLMGRVESMQAQEQAILLAYLERYAANLIVSKWPAEPEATGHPWLIRTQALLPFLLLTGLGLLRWLRKCRKDHKPCVTD
ncbi:MAG: hypothetical protein KZQ88_10295 [Candidatus Thiodiazotropha sp. (ex Dulcina madagascariensis)]|nr:hypothetical protein [Candidatus Thiodiazotropha sp. (ex Dulcina madagascariensis)]MCU7928698.1 hypothetical protein [Candidatus Thiodiazotropha sp. (ex Dulcina madagascariensis)]